MNNSEYKWENIADKINNEVVKYYFKELLNKKGYLIRKRFYDLFLSILIFILLLPILIIISLIIFCEDKENPFFLQERITENFRKFNIIKFRTMKIGSEKFNSVTTENDRRVTKVGKFLRKYRLDELPQLINIIKGDMTFVGTRPEVEKYVNKYTDEMKATLLLPAGVTSLASLKYKNENTLISSTSNKNVDEIYCNQILPEKMKYNLEYLKNISFFTDLKIIFRTVMEVFIKYD